jgi:hypothetical protein
LKNDRHLSSILLYPKLMCIPLATSQLIDPTSLLKSVHSFFQGLSGGPSNVFENTHTYITCTPSPPKKRGHVWMLTTSKSTSPGVVTVLTLAGPFEILYSGSASASREHTTKTLTLEILPIAESSQIRPLQMHRHGAQAIPQRRRRHPALGRLIRDRVALLQPQRVENVLRRFVEALYGA